MDYSALLDSTPFDEKKLRLLDGLIEILYKTTNNQDRNIADQMLNEFKLLDSSWQYCDMIITNSQSWLTKIYATSILLDLVNTRFNLLSGEQREMIRNYVVDLLIKTISGGITDDKVNAFINKLNIIIVAIAKSEWSTTWSTFLTEICSSAKASQELCENNVKLLTMLR